jgi:hypothetical protein
MRAFLVLMLAAGAARAQNSDLGLLLGISGPTTQVNIVPGTIITSRVGASGQINFAFQVRDTSAGRLYLELPLLLGGHANTTTISSSIVSSAGGKVIFTPGVRWNILPHSRVSFYAALGAGVAAFDENKSVVGKVAVTVSTGWTVDPALAFGGGLDFRLTRLLSLRAEARDFVSGKGLGGAQGHNHVIYGFGLGFHW